MANGTNTREQLVNRALGVLGVAAAGQAPAPEDVKTIDELIEPLLAMLESQGVTEAVDPDEVPDEIYMPLAVLLADAAVVDFGMDRGTPDDPNSFAFKAATAERQIRAIQSGRPTYAPAVVEYF